MKRKYMVLILSLLSLFIGGCSAVESKDNNKKLEEIVNEEQINIHFKRNDKKLVDGDTYSFVITESSEEPTVYEVSRYLTVSDGKMGLRVKVEDNTWSISDIYDNTNREEFAPRETSPRYELYLNASWKLEPILDDYIIYLDDYIIDNFEKEVSDITPLTLFKLVDENTGTTFTYDLICVYDDKALAECW